MHKEIDVNFEMSGATDTGLEFGASVDLDEAADDAAFDTQGHVFVSGAFGTLTLGDTDGAYDQSLTETAFQHTIEDYHLAHAGYDGNDGADGHVDGGNILRYDYSLGTFAASASIERDGPNSVIGAGMSMSGRVSRIGVRVGIGYQTGRKAATVTGTATSDLKKNTKSAVGASVSARLANGLSAVANLSRITHTDHDDIDPRTVANNRNVDNGYTHTAIGLAYKTGPTTLAVNAGRKAHNQPELTEQGFGVSAVYNVGMGIDLKAGFGTGRRLFRGVPVNNVRTGRLVSVNTWSLGVVLSF